MRRTTILLTAACLLAGATVGCSSDSEDDKPTVSKATNTPTTAATSPSPSPSPETYKLGDTINIETSGFEFAVTVIAFKDKGITTDVPGLLQDGEKWAQAEVKVCNVGSETFGASPAPWSLAYADGVRVDSTSISGAELPAPEYPIEARVRAGDCVRGNVPFEVPEDGRAERVLYSPGDLDEPVEWQLS